VRGLDGDSRKLGSWYDGRECSRDCDVETETADIVYIDTLCFQCADG
jgi:hypothetical protein